MAEPVKITVRPNGPYFIDAGAAIIVDADGNEYRSDRPRIALCRCGGSTTKPFCDGTHSKIGFDAAEKAVRDSAEPS